MIEKIINLFFDLETDLLINGNTENETDNLFGIKSENYSKASRLFRVTAWCQRFIKSTQAVSKKQGFDK